MNKVVSLNAHLERLIPEGPYCYKHTGRVVINNEYINIDGEIRTGGFYFSPERKTCIFWKGLGKDGAYCNYLNQTSEYGGIDCLMWDQVKECNVRNEENILEFEEKSTPNTAMNKAEKRQKHTPEFMRSLIEILLDSENNNFLYDGVAYTLSENLYEQSHRD